MRRDLACFVSLCLLTLLGVPFHSYAKNVYVDPGYFAGEIGLDGRASRGPDGRPLIINKIMDACKKLGHRIYFDKSRSPWNLFNGDYDYAIYFDLHYLVLGWEVPTE